MSNSSTQWDRLGTLAPKTLSGESKKLYDDIVGYFNTPFTYKLPDQTLVGPFNIELHTPGAGYAWLGMTKSLAAYASLPPLVREIAILVPGYHEKAAYEVYAHEITSGLGETDLAMLRSGKCPAYLDEKCHIAHRVATALCEVPGPLDLELWKESVLVLGREATVAVVHYVGFYKYVSTILNGFDARVPKE